MKLSEFFKRKKAFFFAIFIAFLVAFFDLLTKRLIFAELERVAMDQLTKNPEIEVTGFFNLVQVWNYGVSFGMFHNLENSQIIFCFVQLIILLILSFWLFRNEKTHINYALALIIGGALGNFVDRAKYGAVADFLDFHSASYHWPAFNLADSAVFLGVAILVLEDFIFKGKK